MHKTLLSCDWGTSSFRLRLIDIASGATLHESVSEDGVGWMYSSWQRAGRKENMRMNFYLAVIKRNIKKISRRVGGIEDGIPVIVSGMASSSIGMTELPYTIMPFAVTGRDLEIFSIAKSGYFPHPLHIISGARTKTDVMRGEETQLIGCINDAEKDKQFFIFPGTHSKHVETKSGEAVELKTYMTGELFKLMLEHSILASSIDIAAVSDEKENDAAFEQGVKNGAAENLSHVLFTVRTNDLFKRFSKDANYYYLSGLLIGCELGELSKTAIDHITIVGEEKRISDYVRALKILNIPAAVQTISAAEATTRGHLTAYRRLY